MSNWLNKVITEISPIKNPIVKEAYRMFQKMASVLSPESRKEILSIASESDVGKALNAVYQKGALDFQRGDQMSNDISTILMALRQRP